MTSGGGGGGGTAERWQRVEALLAAALEREPPARGPFLDAACDGDDALRREVDSLLAAHERPGALDSLAADVAPLAARLREPATPPTNGRIVGRYRVLERVAGGGMGVVYRAKDERLDRSVALKFLHPRFDADDSAARRFRLEARAVAALEHPNICTVHEIGETDDGQLYLAMPLYDGETLQRRIARGALPVGDAVGIAVQIARGLAKAHARGIVHRDIKPSNVFVTDDGVVKILDFGIAKLADVTLTGTATGPLGTVAYMSPEQLRNAPVDHRADLWSLGVLLYETLTGRRPFDGDGAPAVLVAIQLDEPAPPSSLSPDVPPALDAVVARLLAKSPDARYQSAQEVERDLLALGLVADVSGGVASSAESRRRTRSRWPRSSRWSRWIAGGAVAAAVVVAAAVLGSGRLSDGRRASSSASAGPERSVVVLPFVDMSGGTANEFFGDGLTEEIINRLAAVPELKVISRTSAMHYKGSREPLRQIAGELHVAHVLEGSVRRAGDRVRITAQLIDAGTDEPLWSQRYDRRLVDVFTVQEDIAREVGRALEVTLGGRGGAVTPRGTRDPAAHELYLRGLSHWRTRTKEGHEQAVSYFQRAIARDSTYAEAYAGLASTYLTGYAQYIPGFADREAETYTNLKWSAERAVALDDNSSQAHRSMAILFMWQRDWPHAEREFVRALQLNPGDEQAHNWYGALLGLTGRIDDAVRESRRAYEMDPLSLVGITNYADQLVLAREYDRAIAMIRVALEIDPSHPFSRRALGILYARKGMYADAERELRRVAAAAPNVPDFRADLAYVVALAGRREEARKILSEVEALPDGPRKRDAAFSIGRAHVALGEPDSAFAYLERADWRWPHRGVRFDPALDPLRADPRFARLSERVDREMGVR